MDLAHYSGIHGATNREATSGGQECPPYKEGFRSIMLNHCYYQRGYRCR